MEQQLEALIASKFPRCSHCGCTQNHYVGSEPHQLFLPTGWTTQYLAELHHKRASLQRSSVLRAAGGVSRDGFIAAMMPTLEESLSLRPGAINSVDWRQPIAQESQWYLRDPARLPLGYSRVSRGGTAAEVQTRQDIYYREAIEQTMSLGPTVCVTEYPD